MKNTLFIVLAIFCLKLNAQETQNHPDKFQYSRVEKPFSKLLGWESKLNEYVVVESPGSAEENYENFLDFIKITFNNPKNVIETSSENKFIKINGIAEKLYYESILPLTAETYDVRYELTVFFKNNRMKIEINSMEYCQLYTTYKDPERLRGEEIVEEWNTLDNIYVYSSNGKPKKRVLGKTDTYIEKYFNGLVDSFLDYSNSMKEDSDW